MEFVIILLFLTLIVAGIVFSHISAKRRREAVGSWARSRGLRFSPLREHDFDQRYPEFDCLQQGRKRYAYNIIDGTLDGRDFLGFDYHYATTSTDSKGRSKTSHHHLSAVILAPEFRLKPLHIRPEGVFDKLKTFFGFDDIDFESAEFSRKYHVTSPDRRWAYDVLHARTIEFLLESPKFSIEFDRRCAIVWDGSTFAPEEFSAATDVICGIMDRLPDYLVRSLHGEN